MPWGVAAAAVVGAVASDRASGKAADAQKDSSAAAAVETRRAADEARTDLFKIFPEARYTAQQGFQGALDVFGQSLPAQADVFTQGNVGAQQAILSGLPQIQNAILGGNIDYSQLQPFQAQQPDLSFFNQTLPQIKRLQELSEQQATSPQQNAGGTYDGAVDNYNVPQTTGSGYSPSNGRGFYGQFVKNSY